MRYQTFNKSEGFQVKGQPILRHLVQERWVGLICERIAALAAPVNPLLFEAVELAAIAIEPLNYWLTSMPQVAALLAM